MDNASMFYRARYIAAEELAGQGEKLKALEICWELRMDPHVGLYRRALVNLLIGHCTDIRVHPDKMKFAREALALLAQVRRDFPLQDGESDAPLVAAEQYGRQLILDIEEEEVIARAASGKSRDEARAAVELALAELERNRKMQGNEKDEGEGEGEGNGSGTDAEAGARHTDITQTGQYSTWTIEGAFTNDQPVGDRSIRDTQTTQKDSTGDNDDEDTNRAEADTGLATPPPSSPVSS